MNDDLTQLAQALEQIEGLRGIIAERDAEVERLQRVLRDADAELEAEREARPKLEAEVERLSGLAESYSDLLHERNALAGEDV